MGTAGVFILVEIWYDGNDEGIKFSERRWGGCFLLTGRRKSDI